MKRLTEKEFRRYALLRLNEEQFKTIVKHFQYKMDDIQNKLQR